MIHEIKREDILYSKLNIKGRHNDTRCDIEVKTENEISELDLILYNGKIFMVGQAKFNRFKNMQKPFNGGQMIRVYPITIDYKFEL